MEQWKTIEPGVWKPSNAGDAIIGTLVEKQPKVGDLSAKYSIDDGNEIVLVWGSTILDDRMQYVSIGQKVRIEYKGKEKNSKGQPLNIYKVAIEVHGVA